MQGNMEKELEEFDKHDIWVSIYDQLKRASIDYSLTVVEGRKLENVCRNRYRDVVPYDHTRISLGRGPSDYINASYVQHEDADRKYILAQGPLVNTVGDFWLMVWEQNTSIVIMLNKVIEKGRLKCNQYWPDHKRGESELKFDELDIKLQFVSEKPFEHYVIREFLLTDTLSGSKRTIHQYHYTAWPDFGLPDSPLSLLEFLYAIRKAGAFDKSRCGPPIIHCSAGIGRSGTFVLVDTCLVLVEKYVDLDQVDIRKVLMKLRANRMGLVQTADQLRFAYITILEGASKFVEIKRPLPVTHRGNPECESEASSRTSSRMSAQRSEDEKNTDDEDDRGRLSQELRSSQSSPDVAHQAWRDLPSTSLPPARESESVRMRFAAREERKRRTSEKIQQMKEKLKKEDDSEEEDQSKHRRIS